MKKIIITMAMMASMLIYVLSSCYKNKEDVLSLPQISFRSDVVPIVVGGGCGCHNNGVTRAIEFSHADTIFYDAILARVGLLNTWVNGGTHPGGGAIDFKANDKIIIQRWIAQGAKDDGGGCTVTGPVTFSSNIQPLYLTTCKGATCHGGISVTLDYNKMFSDKAIIGTMMGSSGNSGHPGGSLSLSSCTVNLFQQWLSQGQPQ